MAAINDASAVQLLDSPSNPTDKDVALPTCDLLRKLNLFGSADDYAIDDSLKALYSTPARSITLIESGARALTNLWSFLVGTGLKVGAHQPLESKQRIERMRTH